MPLELDLEVIVRYWVVDSLEEQHTLLMVSHLSSPVCFKYSSLPISSWIKCILLDRRNLLFCLKEKELPCTICSYELSPDHYWHMSLVKNRALCQLYKPSRYFNVVISVQTSNVGQIYVGVQQVHFHALVQYFQNGIIIITLL